MKLSVPATISKGVIQIHPAYAGKAAVAFSRLKPGETVTVTVESEKRTRTLSQNARMWMLLSVFEELGWHKDEAKVWCCGEFLPPHVRELPDGTRIETKASRTSTLNTEQMGKFMDRIEHFLIDHGIHIPAQFEP